MHKKSAFLRVWLILAAALPVGSIPLYGQSPRLTTASNDFNGDGNGDILWRKSSDGELQIWLMKSFSTIGRQTVKIAPLFRSAPKIGGSLAFLDDRALFAEPWRIAGSRDFDGDGDTDLLSYNDATGEIRFQMMSGDQSTVMSPVYGEDGKATFVGLPWKIVGTFASNQRLPICPPLTECGPPRAWPVEIFWHNSSTGEIQIWHMNRSNVTGRATVLGEDGTTALVGAPWDIVAVDDMNGDGKGDIVWHNDSTSETQFWYMDGNRVRNRSTVVGENGSAAFIGAPWSIVGTNDFNRDGHTDLLWYNTSTGETQIWHMNGHRFIGRATVLGEDGKAAFVGPPWAIVKH